MIIRPLENFLPALEVGCAIFGGSKSAQNHGIWVPQGVCGKTFIMRTTKNTLVTLKVRFSENDFDIVKFSKNTNCFILLNVSSCEKI